jgi:dolichol-phosphate mannosyltransferase
MDRSDVCVLVPTRNEAETVADVVRGYLDEGFDEVLVMDGGSDDGTPELAREAGARVEQQSGIGKGQAVREAVLHSVERPYVLLVDGDGTYLVEDAAAMLEPLDRGYEHVVGNRFADMREGAMTTLNRVGNRLINRAFALVHGDSFGDILSGYRAFTRASFERMTLTADGFGIETEMAVECARRNLRTTTVPITYLPRPSGSNTNLHPVKDGGIIFLELYRKAKTSNPLFYFGSVGVLATLFGGALGAYVGVEWVTRGISHEVMAVAASFAILFGVQLLMFGVLSDLILTLHHEVMRRVDDVDPGRGRRPAGERARGGGTLAGTDGGTDLAGDEGVAGTDAGAVDRGAGTPAGDGERSPGDERGADAGRD